MMNEAEKFAINKFLNDLERELPLTTSFLRQCIDKNILTLDDRNSVMKTNKSFDKVKIFMKCILKSPGAFLTLVEILKKKSRFCQDIACQLVECKKKREKYLSEQRKKSQERQRIKAQDTLSHQICVHLATIVNGCTLLGSEVLPFEVQVIEHRKMIEKLETTKTELDYQEGAREHLSLPQLIERRSRYLTNRADEEYQRATKMQKEAKRYEEKYEGLKSRNAELAHDLRNMKVWTQRVEDAARMELERRTQKMKEEQERKLKKEKDQLDEQRFKDRIKANMELREMRTKYDALKKACTYRVQKREFGTQVSMEPLRWSHISESQVNVHTWHPEQECSEPELHVDGGGLGRAHDSTAYATGRQPSGTSSSSDQSSLSTVNVCSEKENVVMVNKVGTLNIFQ